MRALYLPSLPRNPERHQEQWDQTTVMGAKHDSVVDKDCRAHDHRNLYILGSSVFPTGSTANPTSTLAALALRAAKHIGDELRQNRRE